MSRWFSVLDGRRDARVRMFCFPYAGGSAHIYRTWQRELHDDVDVVAMQPPARGPRMREAPMQSVREMIEAIVPEIVPMMDRPCIFFGYSMGAVIAYEVAIALQKSGQRRLALFIAAARRGPSQLPLRAPIYDLPDEAFIEELRKYGGTPPEILADSELLKMVMPTIRADFALSDTYRYNADDGPLRSRALLIGSKTDPYVPWDDLLTWQQTLEGECTVREIGEGHFFIHSHAAELAAEVRSAIDQLLRY